MKNISSILITCFLFVLANNATAQGLTKTIRQLVSSIALLTTFTAATAQTCQPPAISQLFANNITLSSARLNCNTISGASLYQFQYRQAGTSGWTAAPSSSQKFANITGLFSNTGYQFQSRVYCTNGWTSYSGSQTFTTNAGGNSCSNPIELACGNIHTGSNNTGNYNYTSYPFANSSGMTGPETYHRLTIVFPALVTLNMQPQTADLDLYLMSTCGNANGLGVGQNGSTNSEQISINLNPGTYYIIVDGYDGGISNYTLSVSCTQNTDCAAPTFEEMYITNQACSSVRLNCDAADANTWDWAYRQLNTPNWTNVTPTSNPYYDINGLQSSTTYEYKCSKRCSNLVWSDWSPIRQFTTPNCGPTGGNCNTPIIAYCGQTYSGNNSIGNNNFSTYKYNGVTLTNTETGPEVYYQITLVNPGPLSISLGGLSADLDLFLLSNCNNNAVVAYSGNSGSLGEVITIGNLAAGTYQIVVDGWNYATSNYSLTVNCNGIIPISNDEPCYATEVTSYTYCYPTNATNINATLTTNPPPPAGCYAQNMRDVWFKVQIPLSGKMLVSTFTGTLTDAMIAVYAGAYCTGLTNYGGCFDDTNGDLMPDIQIQGTPGSYVYLRIWGYDGRTGTFSLCVTTLNSFQFGIPVVNVGNGLTGGDERSEMVSENLDKETAASEPTIRLFPVPAQNEITVSATLANESNVDIRILNLAGQLVKEETLTQSPAGELEKTLDISNLPSGTYMLRFHADGYNSARKFVKM